MRALYLMPYHVHARIKRHQDLLRLGDLPGRKQLEQLFRDYLNARQSRVLLDDDSQKMLRVIHIREHAGVISGILKMGQYGYESDLVDVETELLAYQRKITHAELLPFYFAAFFPDSARRGILIIQKFGTDSAKSALVPDIQKYVREALPDSPQIVLSFEPIVPPDAARQMIEEGRVYKMRLVRYSVPSDQADYAWADGIPDESAAEIEFSLKAQRNKSLPSSLLDKFKSVLDGNMQVGQVIETPPFPPERIKVELNHNGKQRTIDLVESMKVRAWYDISAETSMGADGHPVFDSIDAIGRGVITQLRQDRGDVQ